MNQATTSASPSPHAHGRLVLMPNALDHGCDVLTDLAAVVPHAVLQRAAGLGHWVVENAKPARLFLKRVDALVPLAQPLQSLHMVEMPKPTKGTVQRAVDWGRLLEPALQGHDIGLLSDAGLPALADPGAMLVAQAHHLGIQVEPLSGPSSIALAVAASGLNGQSFAFVGYVPNQEPARGHTLRALESHSRAHHQTQVAIETPYRNEALMMAMLKTLQPSTLLSVSAGLTLPGAWTMTRNVAQWRLQSPSFAAHAPAVFSWLAAP